MVARAETLAQFTEAKLLPPGDMQVVLTKWSHQTVTNDDNFWVLPLRPVPFFYLMTS